MTQTYPTRLEARIAAEDLLIDRCRQVFGPENAKKEAERIARTTEREMQKTQEIVGLMAPEVVGLLLSEKREKGKHG